MRSFLPALLLGLCWLVSAPVEAQQFSALIDADRDPATGCAVATADGTAQGIEWRLTASVGGTPPMVTAVERERCEGGAFAAPTAIGGGYPVGLNNGLDGADVVEFGSALAALAGIERDITLHFLAEDGAGADLVGPLPLTIPSIVQAPVINQPAVIPTLHWLGLAIIIFAVLLIAHRHRALRGVAAVLLLCGAGMVWAAHFMADGQVGDWAGQTPLATSPAPSSSNGANTIDIVAVWAASEPGAIHFRVDVADLENAAPTANAANVGTLEDQPLTIVLSGSDPEGEPLSFAIVQAPVSGSLGAVVTTSASTAEVVYTPNAGFVGNDSFSFRVSDGVLESAPATVSIAVTGINAAPSFTVGADQAVDEDAGPQTVDPWATNIDDGDPEVVQGLSFEIVGNTNAALFSAGPAVSATGVLSYTPADDANGSATITLQLRDDGGNANGGVDVSPTQSFTITVNAVNDAPSFVAGPNQVIDEDAGPQTVDPWATAISPGPADEAGQAVSFNITGNTNPALFSVAPAVSPTGVLSYTPAPSANGVATITLVLSDDGGTANGGVDTSAPQSFTISVNAVNNAPSFTVGPDQVVDEDAGPQLVDPWATDIDDGDPEVVQGLSFEIVGNTNPALFSAGPAVSPGGALSYTTAPDAFGVATITLQLRDDGGTANGGVDVSPPQDFSITVNPVDDPPVAVDDAATVDEDSAATLIDVLANDTDVDGGPIAIDSITQPANGLAAIVGGGTAVEYTPDPDYCNTNPVAAVDAFTYTLAPGGSTATVSVTVTCINDAPVNTVPGMQQTPDDDDLVFSTANGNAISVADVDAGNGLLEMTFSSGDPANGTLILANPGGVLATLSGNGTHEVIATGTLTALNLALNGPDGSLSYSPPLGVSAGQTLTISTDDQGNTGLGGPLSDVSTIDISVDAAPVVSSSPADGALVANNVPITVSFSEPVDVSPGITLTCGGPDLITGGSTGNGVTILNLSYTAPLPAGDCTLSVPAASVSDVDLIDPPDNPLADYIAVFTVDAAPEVVSTSPANGDTVAQNTDLVVEFSEPVNFTAASFALECPAGVPFAGGFAVSGSGTSTATINPTGDLPAGDCALTVIAVNIDDVDTADPPSNPVADTVVNFSVDAAPAFVSAIPAEAAVVGTGQVISFTFDEPVDDLGGAITLDCGGAIAGAVSGSGTPTLSFTPSAPLAEGASCVATAVAASIGDTDAFDPPEHPVADVMRSFSVDTAPSVTGIVPANGAVDVNLDTNIVVSFSEPVNFTAAAFSLECPGGSAIPFTVSGDGSDTATIDPTPATLPINTACVFSVDASLVTDVDAADPPDAGSGVTTVGFTTVDDNPPSVVASTPGEGDTVANDIALSISFDEAIDAATNYATLTCGGANLITAGQSGSNTTVLSPTYAGPLPNGASCTLTVLAANITDVDLIDPPDNMAADYEVNFSVDAAPEVTSTLPAGGAVDVPTSSTITVNFSEAVDIAAGGVTLNCGGAIAFDAGPLPATSVTSIVLTPSSLLPEGSTCNGQVVATLVTDSDSIDPPDQMVANFNWSFTTDAAPEVSLVTPAEAAVVSTTQTIAVDFSENVDLSATAFTLDCGAGAIALTGVPALPATNTPGIVLTPTGGLPEAAACVFTVVANQVADSDSNDPPNTMVANFVRNFSVDAAPFVIGTTPDNLATGVDPTSNITVDFSESVNFDTTANAANTSFDLECPGGSPADFIVLTASPAASVVLNPVDNQIAGNTCTLTVRAAGISDADAIDPPDLMDSDFGASFSFASVANDDAYTVTPHLTLGIGAASPQGGGVLVNDIIGGGGITGFGFGGSCSDMAPGNQLDAGAVNGRLTLNADGSFSYEPPAGVANDTRTFCYTVTGGDTANIVFTLQNTELVWFVDAAAAAGGNGTQARPFQTLGNAATVDTPNDTIFLAFSPAPYTGGILLEAGERLIGSGSGSTLAAITGITPVAGSAFPALGGSAPTITCAVASCIALGTGNSLRGFTLGNAGAAGTKISGTAFGTLTVAELTLSGDGRALGLTNGTLNGNFIDIDVTTGNLQGIGLDAVGGTWSVTNQVSVGNVSGTAISIFNTPAGGSATFTGGLSVNKASSGAGVHLNANAAPVNLGAVSITTGAGAALIVDNSAGTTTVASGSLTATGGPALNSSSSALSIALAGAASTNSGTQGINLNAVTGAVNIGNGGSISGATGTAFNIDGSNATIVYGGGISNAAGRSLAIQNRTGGSATFTGAISDTGTGILLNANVAAHTTSIRGGLTLTTGANAAFTASSGGTLEVCDENPCNPAATGALVNTITTTTGTALNVSNSTISANRLEFRSISANGAANGIVLNTTGALGGLSVKGNGGACTEGSTTCSGGWIRNLVGADDSGATPAGTGIVLNNTSSVSLTRMRINDASNYGIRGTSVAGFEFANGVIDGANGTNVNTPFNEGSMVFFGVTGVSSGMTGTSAITNSTIMGGRQRNVAIDNSVGTLNLTVSGNVFKRTSDVAGDDGFFIEADTSANVTVTITNNTFARHGGDHINLSMVNNATLTSTISNNVLHGNYAGTPEGNHPIGLGQGMFVFGASYNGTTAYDVSGNGTLAVPFRGNRQGGAIHINKGSGTATMSGHVQNNVIGDPAIPASGSSEAFGIIVGSRGSGGLHTTHIDGNLVREYFDRGVLLEAGEGAAALNATVTNNTVSDFADAINSLHGIHTNSGSLVTDTNAVCLHAAANSVADAGNEAGGGADIRLRRAGTTTVRLPGLVGTTNAVAAALLQTNNPTATTVIVTGDGFSGGAACPLP